MVVSQPESEGKQRLENIIDSKLAIEFDLAFIGQDPSIVNFEVAGQVLQCNALALAEQLPSIYVFVTMQGTNYQARNIFRKSTTNHVY